MSECAAADLVAAHRSLARLLLDFPALRTVISVGRYTTDSGEGVISVLLDGRFVGEPPRIPSQHDGFRVNQATTGVLNHHSVAVLGPRREESGKVELCDSDT